MVNRSGNCVSHDGAVAWIDRAIALVRQSFKRVCLRGDTDFALTGHFDRWSAEGVTFAFGMDAMPNLVKIAEGLEDKRWSVLRRREKQPLSGERRQRPRNFKEEIVVEKGYRNIRLLREAYCGVQLSADQVQTLLSGHCAEKEPFGGRGPDAAVGRCSVLLLHHQPI